MKYTIKVTDETGKQVFSKTVSANRNNIGSNLNAYIENGGQLEDYDLALWMVSPEVCPWDCDRCNNC